MINKMLFIFLLLSCNIAYAGVFVGASTSYLNINDGYNHDNDYNPQLNVGYNIYLDNLIVSVSTNRLNKTSRSSATKDGIKYQVSSKIEADTLLIGLKRRLSPAIFVSNVNVYKSLSYNKKLLGETNKSSILYGLNLSYFLTKNISLNGAYIAPNQEQSLDSGFNLGLNYNF